MGFSLSGRTFFVELIAAQSFIGGESLLGQIPGVQNDVDYSLTRLKTSKRMQRCFQATP